MSSIFEKLFIIIESFEFILGIWGNGFIGLVLCAEWIKNRSISLFDFILLCLTVSRIGVICTLLQDSIRRVFYPEILENYQIISIMINSLWNLNNSLNIWSATCLIVFYFLKLFHFSHPVFLWLKRKKERVVGTILFGFFLSLFFNILSIKMDALWIIDHLKMERNLTWKKYMSKTQYFTNQLLLHLGSLIPLLMFLISFLLFIFFLWKHKMEMEHHAKESGDHNTKVHVRARNIAISFIILFVVHYLDTLLIIWSYSTLENSMSVIIIETVALFYPSIHPFSVIRGNRKLRQAFANVLRQIEYCFKGM